jgi:ComF family protein
MDALATIFRDTLQFFLPRECAGCGAEGSDVCGYCVAHLSGLAHRVSLSFTRALFSKPVIAVTGYTPLARAVVTSFKDRGRHGLAEPLSSLMAQAWSLTDLHHLPTLLVPIPSARGGRMRRGYEPTAVLAQQLARRLPAARGASVLERRVSDGFVQRKTLRRRQRLATPPRFVSRCDLRNEPVVIIDDVVTTGASLESAAHALQDAGANILGALVVASVQRAGRSQGDRGIEGDTALATRLRWRASPVDE